MSRLSDVFEQRVVGAVFSSIRSRKQLPFPSGPQFTESAQESAIVDQLGFSPFVRDLITQPIIRFEHEGKPRRYSADVFVEYAVPGQAVERFMIEAKLRRDIQANAEEHGFRFAAARAWCWNNDACFCLLDETDIKTTYLQNVRTLAESRAAPLDEAVRSAVSLIALTKASTVASATAALQKIGVDPATALLAVEKAVVERLLDCDLTKLFGVDTPVRKGLVAGLSPERVDPFLGTLRRVARGARD